MHFGQQRGRIEAPGVGEFARRLPQPGALLDPQVDQLAYLVQLHRIDQCADIDAFVEELARYLVDRRV